MKYSLLVLFCAFSVVVAKKQRSKGEDDDNFDREVPLHSYMKQTYLTRARGNNNGSFTVNVRNRTIVPTTIRGIEPLDNVTRWEASKIKMQFSLGGALSEEDILEAELILTSKYGSRRMARFNATLYVQDVITPRNSQLLDTHSLPAVPNKEFSLEVTRAFNMSYLEPKTNTLKLLLQIEDSNGQNNSDYLAQDVWRCFKHGHAHGPYLVLYTKSKYNLQKDDRWKLQKFKSLQSLTKPVSGILSGTKEPAEPHSNDSRFQEGSISRPFIDHLCGSYRKARRFPRRLLTCRKVYFAVKMSDIFSNVIAPRFGNVNYCSGYCYFPIQNHLTPTLHAIIMAKWWTLMQPNVSPPKKPLCVPTKLAAQSVIYFDFDNTRTIIQQEWEGFSAKECGCR